MKLKDYFSNLEKYWSANFLAFLSFMCLFSFLLCALGQFVDISFQAKSFSEYIERISKAFPYGIFYVTIFFPFSCFISARVSIFYIFTIISKKKLYIFISILIILIFLFNYLLEIKETLEGTVEGTFVFLYLLPLSIVGILISIGIYFILLLLERIPKFRVPQSLISQTGLFKKYVMIFYWLFFAIIFTVFGILFAILFSL